MNNEFIAIFMMVGIMGLIVYLVKDITSKKIGKNNI